MTSSASAASAPLSLQSTGSLFPAPTYSPSLESPVNHHRRPSTLLGSLPVAMDAEPESTAAPVPEVAAASTAAAAAAEPAVGEKRALECAAAGPTPAVSQEAASSLEAPFKRQQISRPIGRSTRETVFRLLASTRHAGYVIGKGGTQIKQMREETGARLKVPRIPQLYLPATSPCVKLHRPS